MLSAIIKWLSSLFGGGPQPVALPVVAMSPGVAVHFLSGHAADLKRIAGWGATHVRMDFDPTWDPTLATYDSFLSDVFAAGLTPILITPYNYPSGNVAGPNYSPNGYASVVATAAAHFAGKFPGKSIFWEVMNEPNITQPGTANIKYSGAVYYTYLSSTAAAIRVCAPSHKILTGGTGLDTEFHEGLAALMKAGQVDGIGFHPYGVLPENLAPALGTLFGMYSKRFPVYVTEFGATTAALLLAMLKNANHLTPLFIAYCYQESNEQAGAFNLVSGSSATNSPVTPATGTLAGYLAFTGGKDVTTNV